MMEMGLIETKDGKHRVAFESTKAFDTIDECMELGKEVFKRIQLIEDDAPINVEIHIDEKAGISMKYDCLLEEL